MNEQQFAFRAILNWLLLVIMFSTTNAYPSIGNGQRFAQRAWAPIPFLYQPRARPYAPYYDAYIPDDTVDLYYPQDPYEKYRYYQMPYYYPDQYYYDDAEQEVMGEENPLQPESWYNAGENSEANRIFLQNLIMAQMYKDAMNKNARYAPAHGYEVADDYDDGYVYGEPVKEVGGATDPPKEDKDVRQLESLKQRRKANIDISRKSQLENRWVDKKNAYEPTIAPEVKTLKNKGQDEVVMPRPATPVRTNFHHRTYHQPSVYDAIKKLLIQQENDVERQPQKRSYVLNEDSLVQQLGKLKTA